MTETLNIPLNKLVTWDGNVRRTGAADGIEELAASIAAHGLLQAPVVRKDKGGKYAVIAGRRRLTALRLLVEQGTVAPDMSVPCQLVENTADAGEISLAENVVRIAMHPADQFEAFRDLADRGTDATTIAARFGVSESVVVKRLKLGRLSPVILEAYRANDIGLEEAQAFAIVDDHAAQERVFAELTDWQRNPSHIRRRLTEGEISPTDRRVHFIGLDTYEQAGGAVRRDLFDDEDSGTILDGALLDRLVHDRMAGVADTVRSEGWAWVEIVPELDRSMLAEYRRVHPVQLDPTDEQERRLADLSAEYDALTDSPEADDGDVAVMDRLSAIEQEMNAIEESLRSWSAETLTVAGAIISLCHDGEIRIERGLVRRDDAPEPQGPDDTSQRTKPGIPAVLVADLTAQKTAVLQVTMARNQSVALAAVVHALALPHFYAGASGRSCVAVTLRESDPDREMTEPDSSRALDKLAEAWMLWTRTLPEDQHVPPQGRETLDCDYAARGSLSIWSRRNWAGERWPCRSISQFSL